MEGIIAIIMVFSIPIIAILSSFYYKLQKLRIEGGTGANSVKQLREELRLLTDENEQIKDRLRNVEYLLTDESRLNLDSKEPIQMDYQDEKLYNDLDSKTL